MKHGIKKLFIIFLLLSLIGILSGCGSSGPRGDGVTSCKNCGRKPVYALNFCKDCYDDFNQWMKNGGGK